MSTARQIDEAYVKTGKVRVIFRNYAQFGQESLWAAEAALCAADQGRFWDYHDKLFTSFTGQNQGTFSKANLKRFAAELGLNIEAFNACLDTDKYEKQVRDEMAEGNQRGVKAIPTFFVNEVKIEGAKAFEAFKTAIEAELAAQKP